MRAGTGLHLSLAIVVSFVLGSCGRVEKEILEVPMNSWGVKYRYYNPSEVDATLAKTSAAVVHIHDFVNTASGSGFFLTPNGIMMTAAHVIDKDRCRVGSCKGLIAVRDSRTGGANEVFDRFVPILIDEESDVALFRLYRASGAKSPIPFLEISPDATLRQGGTYWAVGHPQGATVKFSQVIADEADGLLVSGPGVMIFGNSGGPVVDPTDGTVVGISDRVNPDLDTLQVDGSFQSTVSFVHIAKYLPNLIEAWQDEYALCSGRHEIDTLSTWLKAAQICAMSPEASLKKEPKLKTLLPDADEPDKVFSDPSDFKEYMQHYALRDPLSHWSQEAKEDPEFMFSLAFQYVRLAKRIGSWVLDTQSFNEVKAAYESLTVEASPSKTQFMFGPSTVDGIFGGKGLKGGPALSSAPAAKPMRVPVKKFPLREDCLANIPKSINPMRQTYYAVNECLALPKALAVGARQEYMEAVQSAASESSALVPLLSTLELYLVNGGDALLPAETKTILGAIKQAITDERSLRKYMNLDELHYEFQYPGIFNAATFKKATE